LSGSFVAEAVFECFVLHGKQLVWQQLLGLAFMHLHSLIVLWLLQCSVAHSAAAIFAEWAAVDWPCSTA
jgi:hypothetical protein